MFKISQRLRFFAGLKKTRENEKLTLTLCVAANALDGLSHECAVYQKAFDMLCQDTGADYAEFLRMARTEIDGVPTKKYTAKVTTVCLNNRKDG